jgi:hypothetical protein
MPARTCGRRNVSLRYWLVEASLVPGKSRTGTYLLSLQIHPQDMLNMLCQGISELVRRTGGGIMAEWEHARSHASDFNPGFVTFVVEQEPRIWWLGSY